MKWHFEPPYKSCYGLTKVQWKRKSGIEKARIVQAFRDKQNLSSFEWFLAEGDPSILQHAPFPPGRKFEPIDPIPDSNDYDGAYW